jgi:hypothetical protein
MTQPAYTTDLATVSLCDALGTWAEIPSRKSGAAPVLEDRAYIQGAYSISQSTGVATGKTVGLQFDYGANISSWVSGWTILMWQYWQAPMVIATWANGGMRIGIGSGSGDVDLWNAQGNDYGRNPYGGFANVAIDPEYAGGYDERVGTPTAGNYRYFWSAPNMLSAVSKGNPHCADAIRYGRAELKVEYGDATNGYCTFEELGKANDANDISFTADTTNADATLTNISVTEVALLYPGAPLSGTGIPASTYVKYIVSTTSVEMTNNATADGSGISITSQPYNRWGLFQEQSGVYLWKGLMSFGNSTNACDFRDSNRVIIIDDCPRTYAAFNKIEINNVSSRVDWTTVSFIATGTLAPGTFEVIDNADVNFEGCSFTDMGTFILQSNSSILNCIFQTCGLITAAGADFTGSKVLESSVVADASALNWNVATDPDGYLDDMTFTKGTNAHHAVEFGLTSPITMTIRGITSTGFNASNAQNDSTFYVARTSGTVTINVVGCTGNFSYKTAGATVVIVADPVTVAVHAGDVEATDIQNARVFLKAKDGTGPFPFEESVTIVNSGTTATVTHTSHGMASNDYADIKGASLAVNNGVHQITVTNANTYTYTMGSAPGSSPTGTITSTFVALTGLTDVNGDKSTSRVYSSAQPVTGWVRLTPQYKTAPLFGTISATLGYSATGVMISDE